MGRMRGFSEDRRGINRLLLESKMFRGMVTFLSPTPTQLQLMLTSNLQPSKLQNTEKHSP